MPTPLSFEKKKEIYETAQANPGLSNRRLAALLGALELPEIMRLGIAQHGARMKEIRNRGFRVINELESVDGVLHSRYHLLFDPERDGEQQ
jgi:hypothetical protein